MSDSRCLKEKQLNNFVRFRILFSLIHDINDTSILDKLFCLRAVKAGQLLKMILRLRNVLCISSLGCCVAVVWNT